MPYAFLLIVCIKFWITLTGQELIIKISSVSGFSTTLGFWGVFFVIHFHDLELQSVLTVYWDPLRGVGAVNGN